ncbi:hypothetical protein P692DRAFT_201665249, partial [Suillus brevipes Sb2]
TDSHIQIHAAYVTQQHTDALASNIAHTIRCKATFDRRVLGSVAGEVTFKTGQLVQSYANEIDRNFATAQKILPRWSAPQRIMAR